MLPISCPPKQADSKGVIAQAVLQDDTREAAG